MATRMSVFTVIRSPAPPRVLFSARARIERLVIWSVRPHPQLFALEAQVLGQAR